MVKVRSKFPLLNSTSFLLYRKCHYALKLFSCYRPKKYEKLKKKQDKGMVLIEEKLDIVKFISQQIYIEQLLKVNYSKLERFFIKHPKKLVLESAKSSSSSSSYAAVDPNNFSQLEDANRRQEENLKHILHNTMKSRVPAA